MAKLKLIPKYQVWVEARQRHGLSDMHIQMARELDLDPLALGTLIDSDQSPTKEALSAFIEARYLACYKKECPDNIRSIEQMILDKRQTKVNRKARNRWERAPKKKTKKKTKKEAEKLAPESSAGELGDDSRCIENG